MLVFGAKMGIISTVEKTEDRRQKTEDRRQKTEDRRPYPDLYRLDSAKEHIIGLDDSILLLVRFKIGGRLRFLSHAETLRVLQRACARAGVTIQHTQGFNPHPRMSLPLPRPVGVESDDELLCMRVLVRDASCVMRRAKEIPNAIECVLEAQNAPITQDAIRNTIMARLSEQLPEGFELLSVNIAKADTSFVPSSATYVLPVRPQCVTADLKARIKQVLASQSLRLERKKDPESLKSKTLDVRGFLKSIELEDSCVIVRCNVSPAGSIRVEEILQLLELDVEKLAAPIRRTGVQWQQS
jgi:hypothetical protein